MRLILALVVPITAITLTALSLAGGPEELETTYAADDCRRVEVLDPLRRPIVGVEDMAALGDGRLLLSAYDRAFRDGSVRGIYITSVERLTGEPPVQVDQLRGVATAVRALYPHGLALDRTGRRLAFVNRPERETAEVVWGRLDVAGFTPEGRWAEPDACRANDLLWRGADLLASRDRADCTASWRDLVLGSETGSIVTVGARGARELADGLAFANGLDLDRGRIVVAETRGERLTDAASGESVELPGGPDNLTPGPRGSLIAALHPDLFDYWLYTLGYVDRAPSRIVAVTPETERVEVLFDDPLGELFSGASVAIWHEGALIAGSAYDAGLLVCGS